VLLFSARKVGPKVYALLSAQANVSASSCPLTVRNAGRLKKSFEKSIPASFSPYFASAARSSAVTWNIAPAPSQSLAVMIGVWT